MDRAHRAKLTWHCRRGMRELDVVLMRYLERDFDAAEVAERASFERLLSLQDPDIYDLLTGRITVDDPGIQHVVERLSSNA